MTWRQMPRTRVDLKLNYQCMSPQSYSDDWLTAYIDAYGHFRHAPQITHETCMKRYSTS